MHLSVDTYFKKLKARYYFIKRLIYLFLIVLDAYIGMHLQVLGPLAHD